MNYISSKIRALMLLKCMGFDELLKLSMLSRHQLNNVLHGRSKNITLLQKISKTLDVSLDDLCVPPEIPESLSLASADERNLYLAYTAYIDVYTQKYALTANQLCKERIFEVIRKHKEQFNDKPEHFMTVIQSIIVLLKEHNKLLEYLSE